MAFNIESIRQNISSLGYAKRNKFEVFIQAPKILENSLLNVFSREINVFNLNRILRYRIEQVDVPGVSLLSSDVKLYGVGPTQKMPYNAQYFDTTFSILLDKNTDIWDFWYNWINSIVNFKLRIKMSFFFLNPRRIKRNIWTFIISVIGGPITFFLALIL